MEVTCNEFGTNSGDYSDRSPAGRFTKVATQQKLGLRTDWRYWATPDHRFDLASAGKNLAVKNGAVDS
jgi:hypothetical protein